MRKINFLSGINAKLVLAAMALGSFVLTGCEEEDFKVNVPDIDINIPEAEPGVAYVNLSATSKNGNALDGVKFADENGNEIAASKAYNDAATLKIFASKDGYTTVVKTVDVPQPAKGSFIVIPVNFVMSAIDEEVVPEEGEKSDTSVAKAEEQSIKGPFEKGVASTVDVAVPWGAYLTEAQKKDLMDKIDALKAPDTRALSNEEAANLETAKGLLRKAVNNMPTEIQTKNVPVTFIPEEAIESVVFTITTNWFTQEITLTAAVADNSYTVKGEQTLAGDSKISGKGIAITHAHGVEIDHGHGHGGSNAGGGEGGK